MPENIHQPHQTGTSYQVTRMAYNLWNGYVEEGDESSTTPSLLFACEYASEFHEALRIRYPEYFRENETQKKSVKKNAKLFNEDVSYALICSLENIEHDTGRVTKADMFTKHTIKKRIVSDKADSPIEALAFSISEKAKVDMDYMVKLTGLSHEDVFNDLQGIVFKNPIYREGGYDEEYLNADEYLSGNVREKHEVEVSAAENQPEVYGINVSALERVIPKDLEATDIDVRLGATWLPVKDVEDFIFEILDTPGYAKWDINVRYSAFSANWNVEGKLKDRDNIKSNMTCRDFIENSSVNIMRSL